MFIYNLQKQIFLSLLSPKEVDLNEKPLILVLNLRDSTDLYQEQKILRIISRLECNALSIVTSENIEIP
jgi:hypothetical protein